MIPGPAYDHSRRPVPRHWRAGGKALLASIDRRTGSGPGGGGFDPNWWMYSTRGRRDKGWNPKRRKLENQAKRRHYRNRRK